MINVIFNDFNYEILPKQREIFDKYCKLIQWGRRNPTRFMEQFLGLELTDHQKYILLSSWTPATVVWLLSRASGKALDLEEKVPVYEKDIGIMWKKNKELKLGDYVLDENSMPTKITHINNIVIEDEYVVYFEDGEKISCNKEHLWEIYKTDNNGKIDYKSTSIIDTGKIYAQGKEKKSVNKKNNFYIPMNKVNLQEEKKEFDIEPYLFGFWLESTEKGKNSITCFNDTVDKKIEQEIEKIENYNEDFLSEYYLGSYEQKKELLYGIMDACGVFLEGTNECSLKLTDKTFIIVQRLLGLLSINYCKKNDENILILKVKKNGFCFELEENKEQKIKTIINIERTKNKKAMRCITVENASGLFLCGNSCVVTHNSYMVAPFLMTRGLLLPNTNAYIMAPNGGQAIETFGKMEDLAKGNIASALGVSRVFLEETVRQNNSADSFVHDKNSNHVELFNGSTINTLNSVAKNIVGIRSNFSVFDEAGKIDRDFYALTLPFSAQDTNFITGGGINIDCYPTQLPNKNLFLSSAEGVDSELFDRYKLCFEKMMLGDPNYFVCDIDCTFSLNPMKDGKPFRPLIKREDIDDAMRTNPYKAEREYFNRFDHDGGQDVFVKRSTINKFSKTYVPVFNNTDGKKYIISYDPSSKLDNSVIMIGELVRDEERGLMIKLVNCISLIETSRTGEKLIIQQPQQIEKLKKIILDYNGNSVDYDNLIQLIIDAGAGGGGFQIAQNIMPEWKGYDDKIHRGFIDLNDPYMKAREDDYVGNCDKLKLFSATKEKTTAYEAAQSAINQGLVIFPSSPNIRGEIEIENIDADGNITVTYEKVRKDELDALIQIDIAKEQLIGMQKTVTNGKVKFELSHEKQLQSNHDDHADTVAYMLCTLMELRANEVLGKDKPKSDFEEMFKKAGQSKKKNNPFSNTGNPFVNSGNNPFMN